MSDVFVKTTGNDATGDGSTGNPYATPGKAAGVMANGDRICLQSGTYPLTNSSPNTSGGPVVIPIQSFMEGYAVTPGDLGTPPLITAGAQTAVNLVTVTAGLFGDSSICKNVAVDGLGNATVTGFQDVSSTYAYSCTIYGCVASNCVVGFHLTVTQYPRCSFCKTVACGTGFQGPRFVGCWSKNSTSAGFTGGSGELIKCIASGTTGDGFSFGFGGLYFGCVSDNNSGNGFNCTGYDMDTYINCVATNNVGYGFYLAGGTAKQAYVACGGYNNTSGNFNFTGVQIRPLTITTNPWTSSTDFTANTTAGGGAVLRAAGVGVAGQISYEDAGAIQHQDAGGGGGGTMKSFIG